MRSRERVSERPSAPAPSFESAARRETFVSHDGRMSYFRLTVAHGDEGSVTATVHHTLGEHILPPRFLS